MVYCIANSNPSSSWDSEYEHDHVHTVEGLWLLAHGLNILISNKKGGNIYSFALTAGDKLLQCFEAVLDLEQHIEHLSELIVGGRKALNALENIIRLCSSLVQIQVSTDGPLESWNSLINGFPQLQFLSKLELEAQFSEDDAALLIAVLQQCSSLKHLTLWFHEDSEGSSCLLIGIAPLMVRHLESLDIQRTSLTKKVVKALSTLVRSPDCSITLLRLRETNVSANDFSILAESVARNSTLKTLCFSDCGIDDTAIVCLATALTENRTLEEIEVTEWFMSKDTEVLLKQCAQTNPKIKKVNLPPQDLSSDFLKFYHLNPNQ